MKRVILLSVVILLICLAYAFAEVPCKINYQGRLIKDNVPVDGTKTMRFSIHDSLQGGNELWTSGDVNVTVYNGLFRYVIGTDGGDLSSIDWTAGQELYLEVEVETDILTPREELYAYPYAINSHLLEGEAKDYFINTSGETQKKDGGLNIMGNVGIGTTSPVWPLSEKNLIVYDDNNTTLIVSASVNAKIGISQRNIGADFTSFLASYGLSQTNAFGETTSTYETNLYSYRLFKIGAANPLAFFTNNSERVRITNAGNVGIGTMSPGTNKLEVVGGPIKATGGLIIETRTSDPASPATGQTWLRTDINP